MRTYICSVITTFLSLLTLSILVVKNKVLTGLQKRRFIIASFLIMACTCAEFFGAMLEGAPISTRPLHVALKYIELCLTPIIPLVLADVFPKTGLKKFAAAFACANAAFETLSLFFGFVFSVDGQNVYSHGSLYFIYYFFAFLNVLYASFITVRFSVEYQNRNSLSLAMILVFILAGTVFQVIDSNVKIVWLTVAIGVILFYTYYCNMIYQVDPLTGLLNRRSYEVYTQSLKRRAYILLFDINNFKSINDSYGHSAGDMCLKHVADSIRAVYGRKGLCYRIGGDEFCVIIDRMIYYCNLDELKEEFERLLFSKQEKCGRRLSVSVGCASFEPGKAEISEAIRVADEKMYSDKKRSEESRQ